MILLCYWLSYNHAPLAPFEVLDFFSGRGRIAQLATRAGFATAAVDLSLDVSEQRRYRKKAGRYFRSPMDWNGDSGFVLSASK